MVRGFVDALGADRVDGNDDVAADSSKSRHSRGMRLWTFLCVAFLVSLIGGLAAWRVASRTASWRRATRL